MREKKLKIFLLVEMIISFESSISYSNRRRYFFVFDVHAQVTVKLPTRVHGVRLSVMHAGPTKRRGN